jgi:galactonate dehydratase
MPDFNRHDSNPTRRGLMSGAAAIAGMGLLGEMTQAAVAPALAAEDKTTGIKITSVSTIPLGQKTLVKIQTNMGVVGWGEITRVMPKVAMALVASQFELLDGENPTRVEYLWQKLFRAHRDFRGGSIEVHTLSGIDMALWDITGKLHGVPVYRLLGGPVRDRIRIYNTPKAQKTGPGGTFTWSGTEHEVKQLVSHVEDARKRVGPDGSVMFDCHCMLPPPIMIQFANAIEP